MEMLKQVLGLGSDLLEQARLHAEVNAVDKIRTATLERSGQISVLSKE